MSKEQTPITAEEWLDEEYPYTLDGFEYLEIDKQVLDVMEQYAQAKVLEALEREVVEAVKQTLKDGYSGSPQFTPSDEHYEGLAKQYYETEVKPKYE